MSKIVNVLRLVELDKQFGPGTMVLLDDGRVFRLTDTGIAAEWVEVAQDPFPPPKAKHLPAAEI